MALSLPDKWIWDFWLVDDDEGRVHAFYLQASKSLGDPELRHRNVTVGHAVSTDLVDWTPRPDALAPAAAPAWDDSSTWTGSIIRHDDRWWLFYTGTSSVDNGLVQRVGLATSDDLDHWVRHPGRLVEADDRWYERLGADWDDEAWRDPWVFAGEDGLFHMLVTARTNTGARLERGCIGHAVSRDLVDWTVREPITTAGGFGQLEVPQLHRVADRWYLLFCCDSASQSEERRAAGAGTGTFYLSAPDPLGPYAIAQARPLEVDAAGSAYAGRIIDRNGPRFLSWLRTGDDGAFVGSLSDPRPVRCRGLELELS